MNGENREIPKVKNKNQEVPRDIFFGAKNGNGRIVIESTAQEVGKLFIKFAPLIIYACLEDKPAVLQKKDTKILLRRNIADYPGIKTAGFLIDFVNSRTVFINLDLVDQIASIKKPLAASHIQALFILAHELEEEAWRYNETIQGRDIQTIKTRNAADLPKYHQTDHETNADKGALASLQKVFGVKYALSDSREVIIPYNR